VTQTDHLAFFQAAVTVIPILFIAVVVTLHRFDQPKAQLSNLVFGVAAIGAAAYGEVVAFLVLAGHGGGFGDRWVVAWALWILGTELVFTTVGQIQRRIFDQSKIVFWLSMVVFYAPVTGAFWKVFSVLL
jgi:hypothetical protein